MKWALKSLKSSLISFDQEHLYWEKQISQFSLWKTLQCKQRKSLMRSLRKSKKQHWKLGSFKTLKQTQSQLWVRTRLQTKRVENPSWLRLWRNLSLNNRNLFRAGNLKFSTWKIYPTSLSLKSNWEPQSC